MKNVFNTPFRERLNAYKSKLTWADGATSDCVAFLNVYKVFFLINLILYVRMYLFYCLMHSEVVEPLTYVGHILLAG